MKKIKNIYRQIFYSDFDLELFYLQGDGSTEIKFEDGSFMSFYADTEHCSVIYKNERMEKYRESYKYLDITDLESIRHIIGEQVLEIKKINNGVKLILENNKNISFLYRSTEEHLDSVYIKIT